MANFDLARFAKALGWAQAGVCAPEVPSPRIRYFENWLKTKRGPQMNYLLRRAAERSDPKRYLQSAQSVLCFGHYYFPGWAKGSIKVSNYSWAEDYHVVLKNKLELTLAELHKIFGSFEARVCTDTAPVLEKVLAAQAGIGWQGKNTLLLNRENGSYLFLGEILTSIPLGEFQAALPASDHCGNCTRCIDACPTNALIPYELDAGLCISYWNLEHKGSLPPSAPHFENWIAGCDICQEVCPWNSKLIPLANTSTERLDQLSSADILSPDWSKRIESRAISYLPAENWKRNLEHLRATSEKNPQD